MSSWPLSSVTAAGWRWLLPKMVLTAFPQRIFLSVHPLPPKLAHSPTVMIWRKGTHSPKAAALLEVLTAHVAAESQPETPQIASKRAVSGRRRTNGPAKAA